MENLNKLEVSILKRLAKKFPSINEHLDFIKVENRIITGVGMYINIIYSNPNNLELHLGINNLAISTNERIEIFGLNYGLNYEVDITNGKIKFIELVTNGENWNGEISEDFSFSS